MYKGSHHSIFEMCMKQYSCNYGIVHNVEQLLGSCLPQNVSNDPCFSTRHYYWLSQRSQNKISTSMVWLSLTLYNTNKTKYMNVMSEIPKAGWLELQLVTDVLGMSPLGEIKQVFHFLQSSWSHTPPRPSSHEYKSNEQLGNMLSFHIEILNISIFMAQSDIKWLLFCVCINLLCKYVAAI